MKQIISRAIVVVLIVTLALIGISALAESDVVIRKSKIYSSFSMSRAIGTIPAWTSITVVSHTNSKVCKVRYKGQTGYISASNLPDNSMTYTGSGLLAKGTRVYQRPTTSSASVRTPKKLNVLIIAQKNGWTLARTDDPDYDAIYIFVKSSNLKKS